MEKAYIVRRRSSRGGKRKESTFKLIKCSFLWRGVGEGVYSKEEE